MNLFARLAQDLWKQERAGCRQLWGYGPHYLNSFGGRCHHCGAELELDDRRGEMDFRPLNISVRCVKPRWSIRLIGRLGGLGKYWWKGEK